MIGSKAAPPLVIDKNGAFSFWLDVFRWSAAVVVVLFHVRHRLIDGSVASLTQVQKLVYYVFSIPTLFGPPAVMVFFVISGFLVGGSSLGRYKQKSVFSASQYALDRLTRLWIVLVPVFLLTLLFNRIGMYVFNGIENGIYRLDMKDGVGNFYCNLVFLQTAVCEQYGSNGALWSLFNEFWYYVAWPPVMLAIWAEGWSGPRRAAVIAGSAVMLIVLSSVQFVGPNLAVYFLIWLLGVVAATHTRPFVGGHWLVPLGLFAASLVLWRLFSNSDVQGTSLLKELPFDALIAGAFCNLLVFLRSWDGLRHPPFRHFQRAMAEFSFSLYCVHTPLIALIGSGLVFALGVGWDMSPVGPVPYALFVLVTALCIAAGWCLSLFTERRTGSLRRAFRTKPRPASSA